jgi:hypothetical protein
VYYKSPWPFLVPTSSSFQFAFCLPLDQPPAVNQIQVFKLRPDGTSFIRTWGSKRVKYLNTVIVTIGNEYRTRTICRKSVGPCPVQERQKVSFCCARGANAYITAPSNAKHLIGSSTKEIVPSVCGF